MNVFNNQQRSGYEEIASYSPRFYRKIKEMDAIFRFAGWLSDLMARDLERTISNQFVDLMEEETFSEYEAFLGITKDTKKTLEERKAYVNALLIGSGKISKDKIIAIVNQLAECDCNIVLEGPELYINMTFKDNPAKYMNDIRSLLKGKVPSHIEIIYHGSEDLNIVVQLVNTVTVERIRHRMEFHLYGNGEASYLDGSSLLDGQMLLNNKLNLFPVKDRHSCEVTANETFSIDSIRIKKNLYHLDGSLVLDGGTQLNAAEWKEEI